MFNAFVPLKEPSHLKAFAVGKFAE